MNWARLRVPASSANLGPGFDSLGLALEIYLECAFRTSASLRISVSGCDANLIACDTHNLIWTTAVRIAEACGRELPPIELEIQNAIPLGKGLGSSAAALTAGVVIADQLLDLKWTRAQILNEAALVEGHPDNVAACVYGGVVASAFSGDGVARAVRFDLPEEVALAVVIPGFGLPTRESRAVLPCSYASEDVIFNLQHCAFLVAALASRRLDELAQSLRDRLHQPYRAQLIPGLRDLLDLRMPGLFGCVLSGAGPAVLVLYERGQDGVCERIAGLVKASDVTARVMRVEAARVGYTLKSERLS